MPKGFHRDTVPPTPADRSTRRQPPEFTVDAPEDEEWFQRLPPDAQEEYRKRWAQDAARDVKRGKLATDTLKRSILQAGGIYLFTEGVCAVPDVWHVLVAIAAGVVLGCVWHRRGAGRFECITTAIPAFVAMRLAFAVTDNKIALGLHAIAGVMGFLMLIALCAMVGFVRERRVADDEDH